MPRYRGGLSFDGHSDLQRFALSGPGQIQNPDVGRSLQRRFGLKSSSPAPTLAPEIQPVCIVADVSRDVDPAAAKQQFFSQGDLVTAVAGQVGQISLSNPPGSGHLVRVYLVLLSPGTTMTIRFARSGHIAGATAFPMNRRLGTQRSHAEFLFTSGVLIGGGGDFVVTMPTNNVQQFNFDGELVLAPNSALFIEAQLVNAALTASFVWAEDDEIP